MKSKLFSKLNKVLDLKRLKVMGYLKYVSSGYMDLNLDVLDYNTKTDQYLISMAHNFVQNGDLMADPDIQILIDFRRRIVTAQTYQLDSLGIYQEVYNEYGTVKNKKLEKELNSFLSGWIDNIGFQGYQLKTE